MTAAGLLPRDFVGDPAALGRIWTHAESETYTRWLATVGVLEYGMEPGALPIGLSRNPIFAVFRLFRS